MKRSRKKSNLKTTHPNIEFFVAIVKGAVGLFLMVCFFALVFALLHLRSILRFKNLE